MEMKYKPTKPQKVKPAKPAKPAKAAKPAKPAPMGVGAAQTVKIEKPKVVKAPKAPKAPKPEKAKAISFGKPGKVQADKPMKVGKPSKLAGFFEKVDPKIILGAAIALIAVIAVVVLTVVLPAIEARGMQIKEIKVTRLPDKVVYLVGEDANYDGMRITVTRKNGDTYQIAAEDCEITGFKNDFATDSRIITVTYQGHMDIFSIKVMENEKPKPMLKSIRLDPVPKTQYKYGERLDVSGAYIICEYIDGSSEKINLLNTDVYGWDKVTGAGTYTLTVAYEENGTLCTTTYTVTVTK